MTIRQQLEQLEKKNLSPHAALSLNSRGRSRPDGELCHIRPIYQQDRDRIIHSKSFRRLKYKTQVFLAPSGDHYRTRLTHTLEVAQIARTIALCMRLNESLVEAVALGHDLGHTPFGHAGEEVLNKIHPGGFKHAQQSLRVVDVLEKGGRGLNLSFEVRDGIVKHSKGGEELLPATDNDKAVTLEGQLVRIADSIAYVNHDIDDAIRAGVITASDLPREPIKALGESHSKRIDTMVNNVIRSSRLPCITMSNEVLQATEEMRAFLNKHVYYNEASYREFKKACKLLEELYYYFLERPDKMETDLWGGGAAAEDVAGEEALKRRVCDFIAGMTDRYALKEFKDILLPKPWMVY
jgi:dGTPase